VKFLLVTEHPVQQIAAEPGTLAQLEDVLRQAITEPLLRPEGPAGWAAPLADWPLVSDPALIPGLIHLRPFPRPQAETIPHEVVQP